MWLRQNTSVVISFGPFVAASDGVTLVTNLVGTGANQTENTTSGIRVSKNGGALAARHATATASVYDAYGQYLVTLDATDTGTVGALRVIFQNAAAFCPVWQDFHIVPANVYDSLIAGSATLAVNDATVNSKLGAITGSGVNTILGYMQALFRSDASNPSDIGGAYDPSSMSLQAIENNSVPLEITSGTAAAGTATTITLGAGSSSIDHFYEDTLILIAAGTGVGQSRFISNYVGSTRVATVRTWTTNPDSTSVYVIFPFDTISGASAPTAAQNATAVWQDLLSSGDFSTANSIGATLKANVDAQISTRTKPADTQAAVNVVNALTTNNDKAGYGLSLAERNAIANVLLDLTDAVEAGMTVRGAFRVALAALAGTLSGANTTSVSIKNAVANTKARITATVDANGNRTAVTTDQT